MIKYKEKFTEEELEQLDKKREFTEEEMDDIRVQAFSKMKLNELDEFYKNLIGDYYETFESRDEYTPQFKEKKRKLGNLALVERKQEAKQAALEYIDQVIEDKKFNILEPNPNKTDYLRLNNDMKLLEKEISLMKDPQELYYMARYYENNALLASTVDKLVKLRLHELDNSRAKSALQELDRNREVDLTPIKKLKSEINFIMNNSKYFMNYNLDTSKAEGGMRIPKMDMAQGAYDKTPPRSEGVDSYIWYPENEEERLRQAENTYNMYLGEHL